MIKKTSLIFSLILLLTMNVPIVQAQDSSQQSAETESALPGPQVPDASILKSEGFTMVPAYPNAVNSRQFVYEAKPGDVIEDYIYAKNLSLDEATFYFYGADPTFSAQGTPAYKTRQAGGNAEGSWVKFDTPEVNFKGEEIKKMRFTITVPKDAGYGDYRIGIAMEKTKKDAGNPNVTIATRYILHTKLTVSQNPQPVPRDGEAGMKDTSWQVYYFWISLILFITSFSALIWVTLSEKKRGEKEKAENCEGPGKEMKPKKRTTKKTIRRATRKATKKNTRKPS